MRELDGYLLTDKRKFCVKSIHPAETFPLILSIAIVIQGLVFASVQAQGLQGLFTDGCEVIAQILWPSMLFCPMIGSQLTGLAIFIVPYLQLVFGAECAFRSLRSLPFQARGKYDVVICCATVVVLLIVTWVPSHINKQPDTCFASLVWFITRYGELGLELLSIVGGLMIVTALTIFTRLSMVNLVDQHQRIAASRMVYYLVFGIVSLVSRSRMI